MVYFLFLSLLLAFIFCFYAYKKDVVAPAFIFTFGFFFQSIWALLYQKKWELGLHLNTYLVIVFGVFLFVTTSMIVSYFYGKKHAEVKASELTFIEVEKWKRVAFLVFSILFSIYYLYYIVRLMGGNIFSIKSIRASISAYDQISKFSSTSVKISFLIANIRTAIIICGYWFIYVVVNNYLCKKKVDVYSVLIVIITILLSVVNGSRTPAFFMIAAGLAYYFILLAKRNGNNYLNRKLIIRVGVIGLIFLLTFSTFARVLGRKINTNFADYLAIYCGAEVKNLDLFLQERYTPHKEYFGTQTFQPIIQSIGRKIGFNGYQDYKLDLPFRTVGTYKLGNVYTTFYPYIYDFGYIGMVILVIIMSAISQFVYEKAKRIKNKKYPSMYVLTYGVIFSCLLLSFFSNKFYENIPTTDFLKKIIIWYLCNLFFYRLDIKYKNYLSIKLKKK